MADRFAGADGIEWVSCSPTQRAPQPKLVAGI